MSVAERLLPNFVGYEQNVTLSNWTKMEARKNAVKA